MTEWVPGRLCNRLCGGKYWVFFLYLLVAIHTASCNPTAVSRPSHSRSHNLSKIPNNPLSNRQPPHHHAALPPGHLRRPPLRRPLPRAWRHLPPGRERGGLRAAAAGCRALPPAGICPCRQPGREASEGAELEVGQRAGGEVGGGTRRRRGAGEGVCVVGVVGEWVRGGGGCEGGLEGTLQLCIEAGLEADGADFKHHPPSASRLP